MPMYYANKKVKNHEDLNVLQYTNIDQPKHQQQRQMNRLMFISYKLVNWWYIKEINKEYNKDILRKLKGIYVTYNSHKNNILDTL